MPDNRQPFTFAPAKRSGVGLFVGVAGGTGSGKTFTSLRIARGIAGPAGKIAAIDTEAKRMSHYSDRFQFDVTDMAPPFRPERFAQAAEDAERAGYAVLVIDSMTHEWAGEGGVLEWHDELKGNDEKRNMVAWIKPKVAHKAMIGSFLQRRIPIVFCFRAEEKVKVGAGGKPEPQGWTPIGDSRFMFELTTMLTLSNEAPGIVNYRLPRKIQEQHLGTFPDGQHITERAGEQLAAWARGDDIGTAQSTAAQADRTKTIVDDLIARIKAAPSVDAVNAIFQEETIQKQVAWLLDKRPDEHARLYVAANAKRAELEKAVAL